jgi:hypothetical protein
VLDNEQKMAIARKFSDGMEKLGIALIAVGIYGEDKYNAVVGLIIFALSVTIAAWRKKS